MLGSESAMDGASADVRGGRMPLVDSDGSKDEDMVGVGVLLVSGRVSGEQEELENSPWGVVWVIDKALRRQPTKKTCRILHFDRFL